jgi:hypothetical protein
VPFNGVADFGSSDPAYPFHSPPKPGARWRIMGDLTAEDLKDLCVSETALRITVATRCASPGDERRPLFVAEPLQNQGHFLAVAGLLRTGVIIPGRGCSVGAR